MMCSRFGLMLYVLVKYVNTQILLFNYSTLYFMWCGDERIIRNGAGRDAFGEYLNNLYRNHRDGCK